MGDGLLKGLARRAIGAEAALRSRRAAPWLAAEPTSDPHARAVDEDGPMRVARDRATGRLDLAPDTAGQALAGAQTIPPGPCDPVDVRRTRHDGASDDRLASPGAALASTSANGAHADPSPLAAAPSPDPPHAASSAHARAPAGAPDAQIRHAPAAPAGRPVAAPAALLPPTGNISHRSARPGAAPTSRRGSAGAGTAPPTEVHVSIGRVELTAAAPPAGAHARPRRPAASSPSLADYLRAGGRGSGSGGTA